MYTQCKLLFEPFDSESQRIDTRWIPSKFAVVGKVIEIGKTDRVKAKVLETFSTRDRVERKQWEVGGIIYE